MRSQFFVFLYACAFFISRVQAHWGLSLRKKEASKSQNKENTQTMLDFFAKFNEAKQSFYLNEDCQNDALDRYFTEDVTMFTEKTEIIKATSGEIREAFKNNCMGMQKTYGVFQGFEFDIHSFEGNLKDGRGEFHGTMTITSQYGDTTFHEYVRFSFALNLEKTLEADGSYSNKKDWKIFYLDLSKPYE
jgi:ketosteroid isomerase-like protein